MKSFQIFAIMWDRFHPKKKSGFLLYEEILDIQVTQTFIICQMHPIINKFKTGLKGSIHLIKCRQLQC